MPMFAFFVPVGTQGRLCCVLCVIDILCYAECSFLLFSHFLQLMWLALVGYMVHVFVSHFNDLNFVLNISCYVSFRLCLTLGHPIVFICTISFCLHSFSDAFLCREKLKKWCSTTIVSPSAETVNTNDGSTGMQWTAGAWSPSSVRMSWTIYDSSLRHRSTTIPLLSIAPGTFVPVG